MDVTQQTGDEMVCENLDSRGGPVLGVKQPECGRLAIGINGSQLGKDFDQRACGEKIAHHVQGQSGDADAAKRHSSDRGPIVRGDMRGDGLLDQFLVGRLETPDIRLAHLVREARHISEVGRTADLAEAFEEIR